LIGTTSTDIFSLDPATCAENWRTHEDIKTTLLPANRGAAYVDGVLVRGMQDGRVMAFDFKTGKRLWVTTISDPARGESVPSAPIVWNGLVLIGNAGGDYKGGKGKMYALEAKTGKIVWQFFLVPKVEGDAVRAPLGATPLDTSTWNNNPGIPISGGGTWTSYTLDAQSGLVYVPVGNPAPDFVADVRQGANLFSNSVVVLDAKTGDYRKHFQLVPADWHDWDVSNTPAIVRTHGGKQIMTLAPKDGHLYAYDLATNQRLYRVPVTRVENVEAKFSFDKETYFCPGAVGGGEWNGVAYDPRTNLVLVGQVDWCTTVQMRDEGFLKLVPVGVPWAGNATFNPLNMFGVMAPTTKPTVPTDRAWAGWVYGVDADSGVWKWRVKTNYPVLAGITPTAGGVAFFGDVGGNFYALDAANGQKLWGQNLGGAMAGGVITYTTASGAQRVAVASGFTMVAWPTKIVHAKIVVLGLDEPAARQ
jgi:alcohol dehydrogenase (cytochrome c)